MHSSPSLPAVSTGRRGASPSAGRTLAVLLLGAAMALPAAAAGKTYRWRDAQGRVHFSDVPTQQSEEIRVNTASGTRASPRQPPPPPAEGAALTGEDKVQACQRKREQLATYISASKVTETDALGNTKTYSDVEKEKLVQRTQVQVRESCGEG